MIPFHNKYLLIMIITEIIREEILLHEGLSDIVYHYTSPSAVINVLKTNKFNTSSNLGTTADAIRDKGRFFYFSTQRTKGSTGYGKDSIAVFVLDGRKLMSRYKGFPLDYWGWSQKRSDYETQYQYSQALSSKEMEDRIVTDKPYIENASDYIIEIHLELERFPLDTEDFLELKKYGANTPIYIYNDVNAWKLQDKRKAIPISDYKPEAVNPDKYHREDSFMYEYDKLAPLIQFNQENGEIDNTLSTLLKKFVQDRGKTEGWDDNKILQTLTQSQEKISEDIKEWKWLSNTKTWDDYYHGQKYTVLSSHLHNAKSNRNPYYRELLKVLITDMKQLGAKDFKDYMKKKLMLTN